MTGNIARLAAAYLGDGFGLVDVVDFPGGSYSIRVMEKIWIMSAGSPSIDAMIWNGQEAVKPGTSIDQFCQNLCDACDRLKADHAEFRRKIPLGIWPVSHPAPK